MSHLGCITTTRRLASQAWGSKPQIPFPSKKRDPASPPPHHCTLSILAAEVLLSFDTVSHYICQGNEVFSFCPWYF